MSGPDPDLDAERRREAGRWPTVAAADMRVMRMCLDAATPEAGVAAYMCQQAAEKLVKGLLVAAGVGFARTHDMARLGDLAAAHYPARRELLAATGRLTAWSSAYPTRAWKIPSNRHKRSCGKRWRQWSRSSCICRLSSYPRPRRSDFPAAPGSWSRSGAYGSRHSIIVWRH